MSKFKCDACGNECHLETTAADDVNDLIECPLLVDESEWEEV